MSQSQPAIPGFKAVFTTLGVIYVLMASSMLVRGVGALREFGVPESAIAAPVLEDIFLFFYQYMALMGLFTVLFGHVTRERKAQVLVASVFTLANILVALRDLVTSDSRFGNHLYRGDKTLVFVCISLAYAAAFGCLVVKGLLVSPARASVSQSA